jgi:hypothetical protein
MILYFKMLSDWLKFLNSSEIHASNNCLYDPLKSLGFFDVCKFKIAAVQEICLAYNSMGKLL